MVQGRKSEAAPPKFQRGNISAWRAEVESFFEIDWGKLQRLVMQLEEHAWANDDHPDEVTGAADGGESPAAAGKIRVSKITGSAQRVAGAAMEEPALKSHRLEKLAERLEDRIRTASARSR